MRQLGGRGRDLRRRSRERIHRLGHGEVGARIHRDHEARIHQLGDMLVADFRGGAAEDDGDQALIAPARGRGEVEPRRKRVAGLEAIGAVIVLHEPVVAPDHDTVVRELGLGEVRELVREILHQPARQDRHVARGGYLSLVRQAVWVLELRACHAKRARLCGHQTAELLFRAAEVLGDHQGDIIG